MIGFHRILVPTDFSPNARTAFHYAVSIGEKYGAELLIMHIVQDLALVLPDAVMPTPLPTPATEQLIDTSKGMLEQFLKDEDTKGLTIRLDVRIGSPFHEIVAYAAEQKADLIVMGSHGRSALAHMFMGSVAEKVVRKARCAVLTVQHQFEEEEKHEG